MLHTIFNDVWGMLHTIFTEEWGMLHTIYNDVGVMLHTIYNDVWAMLHTIYNDIWGMLHTIYNDVGGMLHTIYNEVGGMLHTVCGRRRMVQLLSGRLTCLSVGVRAPIGHLIIHLSHGVFTVHLHQNLLSHSPSQGIPFLAGITKEIHRVLF